MVPFGSSQNGWSTAGNAGTSVATDFIGTTDNVPFSFRVNGTHAGRIDQLGRTSPRSSRRRIDICRDEQYAIGRFERAAT
ncbi:MAG: hypothetical protein IPH53_04035 [Flavobacteriales bacterium]|nr:hypothetical protein [Flavobacteriales bacterium]